MLLQPLVLERIHHREHLAAAAQVGVERLELRREQVVARPGQNEDRRVVRHFARARQDERLDLVVGLLQGRLRLAEPRAVAAPGVGLAVPLDHVDDALALARHLDEAVRELLLLGVEHLLGLRLGLEHDRAVRLDAVAPGQAGLAVRVGALPGELPVRVAGVLLEQIFRHALAGLIAAEKGDRVDVGLETPQELDGLRREAEPLVLGEVPPGAVAERQRLDDDRRAQHQRDRDGGVHAVAHRSPAEEAAEVLHSRQQRRQDEHDPHRDDRPAEADPLRAHEGQDRAEPHDEDPEVAAPVEQAPDHPFHRRASSERKVRNSASTVKFR